jgi:ABC-2 type transport system ATP-binding protein
LSQNCISVRELVKTYGELEAVSRISFDVHHGEILGILGPNGSGKTTTVKSILGLITFDDGQILIEGMDIEKMRGRILQRTGAVLEGARNTYWYLSPRENLSYFAGSRGVSQSDAEKRIEYLLESLDLVDVADKELRQFSSGMKQKCALACAFVHDPEVLLLDEPTLGLDVEISRHIRAWLRELVEEHGKTILITSHNMDFIESVCDRILIISKGRIISHETVASLKEKFAGRFFQFVLKKEPHQELLDQLEALGRISLEKRTLRIELSSLDSLLPMVEAVSNSGCGISDFVTVENDLEDIFLDMIGSGGGEKNDNP